MKQALHYQCGYVSLCVSIFKRPHWRSNNRLLSHIVRIMKLTGILLLAVCLHVSAAVFSQQVTLNARSSSLSDIFVKIHRQTGYNFIYNNKLLKNAQPVTVNAENAQLQEVLQEVFKGQPLSFSIIEKTIVVKEKPVLERVTDAVKASVEAMLPDGPVKGTVTDENGEPLVGVSVILQVPNAQAKGTSTGANGGYQFAQVPENSVLIFNMIGFKRQEVQVKGRSVINVKLAPDVKELQNVVVTGYQEIKKESFTGQAVTVSGEDLKRVNPQNLLQSIQAFDPSFKIVDNNLSGANPNSLPTINVRGTSALPTGSDGVLRRDNITGNVNLPVFILDGFEVNLQKVFDLDMNRIQSVTLLKDAAATAIYGSRAANGVLVITTKAPQEGKLRITYDYETNVAGADLSAYQVLNASDKLDYEVLAGIYDASKQERNQDQLDALYYAKKANVVGGVNTYWLSQPVRTAVGQKHSLYMEGGSEIFRYGIDLRYQSNPGVMKSSGRNRYSGGMNFTYNKNDKFQFRNDLTIAQVQSNDSPYGSFADYVRMNPYYPIHDENGNLIRELDQWSSVKNGAGGGFASENVLNPLYDATLSSFNKSSYTEIVDALSADIELAKGLRLKGIASLTSRNTDGDIYKSPLANEFYFYEASRTDEKGRYTNSGTKEIDWDGNLRLTWVKQLGDHFFNFVGGANVRTELYDYKEYTAIGFPNDRFTSIGFAKGYAEDGKPASTLNRSRLFGSFLSTNYSFKNKYLLDATVRVDGSSKFGVDNKLAPFWSVGLGWNLHNEPFLKGSVISQLRLRTSTGLTGSVDFDPYLSKTTYQYYQDNWYSSGIGATVKSYGNENLSWQKTLMTDIGIELGLFKDRIYISPRYYRKKTNDILADVILPPSTGFQSYKENLGDMENNGFELNMRLDALRKKDWSLNFTANFTRNTNKIVRISNALKRYNDRANEAQTSEDYKGVPLLRYAEGQSINAIYAVKSLGIDPQSGREIFVKRDGSLTYDWNVRDITVVGDATPDAYGFFGTTFTYKNFMLTANFETKFGGDLYNQTLVDRVENADPRFNVDKRVFEDKWKETGDHTFFKNIADLGDTQVSSRFVQPDNMLNFQSLYLSYDFEKRVAAKLSLSSLRFSLNANDIARWSSVKEERGIDYPFARSFTFSLQGTF